MSFVISGAMLGMSTGIYIISSYGGHSHYRKEEYVCSSTDSITTNIPLCCKGGRMNFLFTNSLLGGGGGGGGGGGRGTNIHERNEYSFPGGTSIGGGGGNFL